VQYVFVYIFVISVMNIEVTSENGEHLFARYTTSSFEHFWTWYLLDVLSQS